MATVTGHCLCGAVTYSADADNAITATCHCTDCQRQSGAAFSVNFVVPRDSFEIEGESLKEYVTVGTDTETPVRRLFCGECGSPLASLAEGWPNFAIIKSGTLDDTSVVQPTMHTWTGSAQDWVDLGGDERTQLERGAPTQ